MTRKVNNAIGIITKIFSIIMLKTEKITTPKKEKLEIPTIIMYNLRRDEKLKMKKVE